MASITAIKWTRKTGGGFTTYTAKVGRTFYKVTPAPYRGWYVMAAQAGGMYVDVAYEDTAKEARAWVANRDGVEA
jgi:hypothetical protein